jgi:hypothetical protein
MEYFMRPAMVLNTAANQRAHCELFNPIDSSYKVIVDAIWVSKSSGFTVLGKGGPMLDNASFPISNGLPIRDGAPRQYSSAHARTKLTTSPDEVIQGGQFFCHEGTSTGLIKIENIPIILGKGNGLLVRSNTDGEKLMVSFLWHEEPFG